MAISQTQWDKAKTLFEAGLSLSQIADKTGIDKSTISKKAKFNSWQSGEHSDYIEAKKKIVEKKSTLPVEKINTLDEIADEQIRRQSLIFGNAELLANQIPQLLQNTIVDEIDRETGEITQKQSITPSDLKILAEANDRIAITLKVADRHAPKTEIVNTNAQQNNESKTIVFQRISKKDNAVNE